MDRKWEIHLWVYEQFKDQESNVSLFHHKNISCAASKLICVETRKSFDKRNHSVVKLVFFFFSLFFNCKII